MYHISKMRMGVQSGTFTTLQTITIILKKSVLYDIIMYYNPITSLLPYLLSL